MLWWVKYHVMLDHVIMAVDCINHITAMFYMDLYSYKYYQCSVGRMHIYSYSKNGYM